jgi:hypothetical protein
VIARELAVDAMVEGSVSRAGGRIRVLVQLIDGQADSHLWAEQYDRELSAENIFGVRSEIVRATRLPAMRALSAVHVARPLFALLPLHARARALGEAPVDRRSRGN